MIWAEEQIAELNNRIAELEGDASLLACLYAAGVEQWDGFDDACARNFRGEGKASATAKRIADLENQLCNAQAVTGAAYLVESGKRKELEARIDELETKAAHIATIEAELVNQKAAYATVAHNLLNYRKIKLADNLRIITLEAQLAELKKQYKVAAAWSKIEDVDTTAQLLNCG